MSMSNETLNRYFELYSDVWRLFKQYCDVSATDDYWQQLLKSADEIYKKYDKAETARLLLIATMQSLDKIYLKKVRLQNAEQEVN